uniref:Tf2-1-like SH3-like domain-containing protein n=1 Tax=Ananas comosus var. bracteatus TaxID=296719 RepID=A0A6V7P9D7_ANACO|nr:unnamed protein product [Ananas comosus var. bracteatus]
MGARLPKIYFAYDGMLTHLRGPVPDRRDRSPVSSAAQPARQPVPGSRDRSLQGRDRFCAGRDRFPNVGFSASPPLSLSFSLPHTLPTLLEREREGEEGEEEEKELAWRPWSTIFFLISRLWRLGACFWSFVEDQTSTLLGFELGLELLLRLEWKTSTSHLRIKRGFFTRDVWRVWTRAGWASAGSRGVTKVSPTKGVRRFGIRGKLSPRFIGPYEVLERIGPVAYRLALPPNLSGVHNVFHVSTLRKYVFDPTHILESTPVDLRENLSFEEHPVRILAREVKRLRNREIPYVKILWSNHDEREATWELESAMQEHYPYLFSTES